MKELLEESGCCCVFKLFNGGWGEGGDRGIMIQFLLYTKTLKNKIQTLKIPGKVLQIASELWGNPSIE